ncbi:transcription termination factor NusA [Rosistilla oblonga]|uniref:transcription termination factor NusA n=1 Tax=Rosistilla oblonga TaxID=2527990 RepID=UPI003A9872AB
MNPQDLLRYVDSLHREKNIDPSLLFSAIEAALATAARRHYGEEADIVVRIDHDSGKIHAEIDGAPLDQDQVGRIGAQTAKQVIIQKVREAERDALMAEYREQIGQMVSGVIQRADGGVATVQLGNVEAILPRSEQISGESLHANERVRAVVFEVRATGNRVRVVLSRTRPQLVKCLFEQEIPELSEGVIAINSISREPGYRSKVAVSSTDSQVDPIAVCVGYRGSRIKSVREELAGEHIDVVRYSDDPQILIPNALQPAEIEQVLLCNMIGRAIVLVQEDQLSLAIGRRGQNVRLASKLCGWDIEIMTGGELEEQIERAVTGFSQLEGMTEDLAQQLVEQGYLSYDDLSVIEPETLMQMGELTAEQVDVIVEQAETQAEEAEAAATEERKKRKQEREAAANAAASGEQPPAAEEQVAEGTESEESEDSAAEVSEETQQGDGAESPAAEEAGADGEAEASVEEVENVIVESEPIDESTEQDSDNKNVAVENINEEGEAEQLASDNVEDPDKA